MRIAVRDRTIRLAVVLLAALAPWFVASAPAAAAEKFDPKTKKTIMELFRASPNAIPLEPRDKSKNLIALYRKCDKIEGRKPGPIDIQRTIGGMASWGIPTFFRAPVALCPQDLKAGKVDVAIMGAPVDMSTGMRGTGFGPSAVRTGETHVPWGAILSVAHPSVGEIDFMQVLKVVDYGDAAVDNFSPERTAIAVHHLVKQVAETGTIPVIVGGDHSLMYANVVAVTDVYGKGKVAVIHFDAHFDGIPLMFGHYLTHGAMVRRLIDEKHIKGEHLIQIGLNSGKPGADDIAWMRKNKIRYHFMDEITKKGWQAVLKEAIAEARGSGAKYFFISLDTDVLDPAYAPGMGTPEPGGMTVRELFPMLRAVSNLPNVVGMEMVELNPLTDHTYRSRLVAVRALREMLTGLAMRRKGIKDPFYADKKWQSHGQPAAKKKR